LQRITVVKLAFNPSQRAGRRHEIAAKRGVDGSRNLFLAVCTYLNGLYRHNYTGELYCHYLIAGGVLVYVNACLYVPKITLIVLVVFHDTWFAARSYCSLLVLHVCLPN